MALWDGATKPYVLIRLADRRIFKKLSGARRKALPLRGRAHRRRDFALARGCDGKQRVDSGGTSSSTLAARLWWSLEDLDVIRAEGRDADLEVRCVWRGLLPPGWDVFR